MNRLGKILKLHCVTEGIEQKQLASDIGIDPKAISRIIKGNSPSLESGIKIMAWLFRNG